MGRDGTGQDSLSQSGTGCGTVREFGDLSCPVLQDKTGQSQKGRSKTEKRCSKTENVVLRQEKDVLKQKNDVLKQEICSFFEIFKIHFVPGRPGTSGDRGVGAGTFAPAIVPR